MREVMLQHGLVTFDGSVVELFGFGEQGSRRIHVRQIDAIDWSNSMLSIGVGPAGVGIKMMMRANPDEDATLSALVGEVRQALS